MNYLDIILLNFIFIFLIVIAVLVYIIFNYRKKIEIMKKHPSHTLELDDFIHDLTSGKGLVEIKRVDPNTVYQRSVRDV